MLSILPYIRFHPPFLINLIQWKIWNDSNFTIRFIAGRQKRGHEYEKNKKIKSYLAILRLKHRITFNSKWEYIPIKMLYAETGFPFMFIWIFFQIYEKSLLYIFWPRYNLFPRIIKKNTFFDSPLDTF